MRKLVVCLDGTGNAVGDRETNVLKLYKALEDSDTQIRHYVMGVGTNDSTRMFGEFRQKVRGVLGLGFGRGLEDDVLEAYGFLCRHWRTRKQVSEAEGIDESEAEADRIYIFGFSRGAYAARVLAGFIHNFGLVTPEKLYMIAPVFRAYRRVTDHKKSDGADTIFQSLREYEQVLRPEAGVPIRCLGLFDTVSSMVRFRRIWHNIKTHGSLMELGTHAGVDTNSSVRIVLHALAIDERRSMFRPQFWQPECFESGPNAGKPVYWGNRFKNKGQDRVQIVRQRWFPGYHSDVGGSPPEDKSGIGKASLLWMIDALKLAEQDANAEDDTARATADKKAILRPPPEEENLELRTNAREKFLDATITKDGKGRDIVTPGKLLYAKPDGLAPIHDSIWGNRRPQGIWLWSLLEIAPKSIKRRAKGTPRLFRRGILWWYLPLFEPRHIPADHEIDETVHERWHYFKHYNPPNLDRTRLEPRTPPTAP